MWARVRQSYLPFEHLAAEVRFNGERRQYVYAEFDGTESIGYEYDRVREFTESLFSFRKLADWDRRLTQTLSSQLVDGGPLAQPAPARLSHVGLELATADNRSATIDTTLEFEAGFDGLRVVPWRLMNHRNPYKHDWQSERNRLVVRRVTTDDGTELPFSHRYHELQVLLPQPVAAGEKVRLRVETEGEILTDWHGEHADVYFSLMSESWFPQPFRAFRFLTTYDMKVRTKKPYRPVSSGTQLAFREDGDSYELESRCDQPSVYVAVFAGKYKTHEERFDGLTVRMHAYAMARKTVVERLPKLAEGMIRFFEQHLGPYPFDELDIVEVPEYGFGIAPSGMVLLTTEAYKPHQDWLATYYSFGINARLAHEIAHQWFGHKATPATTREDWLAESFAEYFAGLFMAASNVDERKVVGFQRMLAAWQAAAALARDAGSLEAANMLGGEEGQRDRQYLLYNRGPLVLHMLHTMVGTERFMRITRRFLDEANMGPATTEDLAEVASQVAGFDLRWFFEQWHRQGGIPEIRVEHRVERGGSGGHVLVGRVEQAAGPAFKKMVIPLVIELASGQREARLVTQERPVQEFRFELPAKPKSVTVDPAHNNLATYR